MQKQHVEISRATAPFTVNIPARRDAEVVRDSGRGGGSTGAVSGANNPVYRGETIGSYTLVFNTILNWDSLGSGRKLDER